jgi:hypothetical protein
MCAGAMPKSARGSDIRLVPNLDRSVALGTRMLIRSGDERGSAPWASEGLACKGLAEVTRQRSERPPVAIVWQGYAEADFGMVGPTQQGLLAVLVARGDEVAAGVSLFAQDDADDRAARDQAAQAARQLVNLEEGGKPTEIEQVTANLADAHATLLRTVADLGRGEALLPKGDATKPSVDQLRADQLSAQAKVESLQAALAQSRAPMGREGEIPAQRAAVAASRAALAMAGFVRPLAMRSGEAARFTQSTGFRLTCISMSCCPATGGSPQASSPFWCTAKRPHNSGWQA